MKTLWRLIPDTFSLSTSSWMCYGIIQLHCTNSGHLRLIWGRNQLFASQVNTSKMWPEPTGSHRLQYIGVMLAVILWRGLPEGPGNSLLMPITMLFHTVKIEVSHHKLYLPNLIFRTACNCCHSTLKCNTLQIILGWNGHITIHN